MVWGQCIYFSIEFVAVQMAFRPSSNYPSYYENNNPRLGYSNVSKGFGYSNRNPLGTPDDHNMGGELEYMLENERKKFKEVKERLEHDLDNERKMRIEFENKLIKLKDEFSRKDVEASELQFKINNLLHQNQDLAVENDRMKHELGRLEEIYGGKIHQLQGQLEAESRNFEETTMQYNQEFEKFKKEGQEYVEQLNFDYDRKIKNLEEKCKALQLNKKDMAMENKKLNDILISNKLNFEEEIRDIKNRARDEEVKRTQQMARNCEQKVKMVEEAKEVLVRKNQELLRALQDKERVIGEVESERTEEVNKLRQDLGDLNGQNNHLNYLLSKLKQENADKDNMIARASSDSEGEANALRGQLEQRRQEIAALNGANRDLRNNLKEAQYSWEKERRDLIERCNALESEARKYRDEYQRICDVLKSKINSTIDGVSHKR